MKTSVNLWTFRVLVLVLFVVAIGINAYAQARPAIPIPDLCFSAKKESCVADRWVQSYMGQPAAPRPITAPAIPQNPYMGSNPYNNLHDDTYASDTYPGPGPLGKSPTVLSTFLGTATVLSAGVVGIDFDSAGRLVAGSILTDTVNGIATVRLVLIDPDTLATLAMFRLPTQSKTGRYFRPAGSYFYTDNLDRTVIGTIEREIWLVSHTDTAFNPRPDKVYDLSETIPETDEFQALVPDFFGRIWFTTKGGMVGSVDPSTGNVLGTPIQLTGEKIDNGTATDETGGVFVVSNAAMYRFDADPVTGGPVITWRESYDAGTHVKAGQIDIGSGTTPTLMGTDYVTISDNAEPRMHVLVYRRAKTVSGPRLVCQQAVFSGTSSNENSLIATDRSIVVENNFGYKGWTSTTHGQTTKPGIARVDLDAGGGCHTAWTNEQDSIPTLVSKMSLANGLIYTYTKPRGPANADPWYFTAIDFETGNTVFKQLAGLGPLYDNDYAGIFLGPNGTAYVGVLGGVVAMRDTE
jgi:hypothetical protein